MGARTTVLITKRNDSEHDDDDDDLIDRSQSAAVFVVVAGRMHRNQHERKQSQNINQKKYVSKIQHQQQTPDPALRLFA